MRLERVLAWIWLMMPPAVAHAAEACPDAGPGLYYACSSCHGVAGEANEAFGAPALAGLSEADLVTQLENFKGGLRGTHPDDALGLQMAFLARTLRDDAAVRAVSCYIATLASAPPQPTLRGDPGRGRSLYATCGACHGERGQGNPALQATALARQADWYLQSQLQAYRAGWRGTHPDDILGQQMRAATAALPDERSILDVVAYIVTLR